MSWLVKGLFKADDYYHLGKLIDRLLDAGASSVVVGARKQRIYALVPGNRAEEFEAVLLQEDVEFAKRPTSRGYFVYAVRW